MKHDIDSHIACGIDDSRTIAGNGGWQERQSGVLVAEIRSVGVTGNEIPSLAHRKIQ
jgi:hypothetical protein